MLLLASMPHTTACVHDTVLLLIFYYTWDPPHPFLYITMVNLWSTYGQLYTQDRVGDPGAA